MNKQLFIDAIDAIQQQCELDDEVSKHLGKAFPNAMGYTTLNKKPGYLDRVFT